MVPWAKVNPSVPQPTPLIGNQGQRLGPQSHWVPLGATQRIPGLYFQSEPGQWMDWLGWYATSNVHLHCLGDRYPIYFSSFGSNGQSPNPTLCSFCSQHAAVGVINWPFSGVIQKYSSQTWYNCSTYLETYPTLPVRVFFSFLFFKYEVGDQYATHWKRPWCWEELGAGGEGDDRGWDGWMASPTQWTWVWVNSGSWWWTARPGVLWFMGSQGVWDSWATELNW